MPKPRGRKPRFPIYPSCKSLPRRGLAGRVERAKRNRKHRTQRNAEAPPRSNRPASNRSLDRKHTKTYRIMISFEKPSWADELDCAVTLCDTEGIVCYQNERSRAVNGDVRGQSLLPCHNDRSREIIRHLLETGSRNVYTIENTASANSSTRPSGAKPARCADLWSSRWRSPARCPTTSETDHIRDPGNAPF